MSQESQIGPAATLNYAPAEPRSGLRIFAGVTLVLWSIFDLGSALVLLLFAFFTANYGGSRPLGALFLVLGIAVAAYSVLAMYCAVSILKKMHRASDTAMGITSVGEILCWIAALITLVTTYYNETRSAKMTMAYGFGFTVVCVAIPGAVSITRIMLSRLVKQEMIGHARNP